MYLCQCTSSWGFRILHFCPNLNWLGEVASSPFFQMLAATTDISRNGKEEVTVDVAAFQGTNRFGQLLNEEYLPELRGLKKITVYDKMQADPVIEGLLTALKQPIISGDWQVVPSSDKRRFKAAAETVAEQLGIGQYYAPALLKDCWIKQLEKFLCALDYGWQICVMNWENVGRKTVLKELIDVHPRTILSGTKSWEWNERGDLIRVWQTGYKGNKYVEVSIPYDRCFHFVIGGKYGNPEGRAVLRTPYKPWMLCDVDYRLLSIANQRASSGTPVIYTPPGISNDKKQEAEEAVERLHVNETGWLRLTGGPPEQGGYMLDNFKMETDIPGLLKCIEHHNTMKGTGSLFQWLFAAAGTKQSANPGSISDPVEFTRSCLDARAKLLSDAINAKIVYDICRLNHPELDEKDYPQVRCHVSRLSAFGFADAIRKALGNDQRAVIWGPRDEEKFRTKMELPEIDSQETRKESDYIIKPPIAGGANNKGSQPNNPSSGSDGRIPEAKKEQ